MPSWAAPALPAWFTPSGHPPFVGRTKELGRLQEIWGLVESGARQAVFVGGEPGSGKTRLGVEVAKAHVDLFSQL